MNDKRRTMIKSSLPTDVAKLCSNNNPVTDNLLGDDLTQQVKQIREDQKQTLTRNPKPAFKPRQNNTQSNGSNYKGKRPWGQSQGGQRNNQQGWNGSNWQWGQNNGGGWGQNNGGGWGQNYGGSYYDNNSNNNNGNSNWKKGGQKGGKKPFLDRGQSSQQKDKRQHQSSWKQRR
jgi:hypothetical protein